MQDSQYPFDLRFICLIMWTCTSPAPPGPPPTANPTSPSTSASPIATAPTCANATSPTSPNCDPKEIAAIELALRFKEDLAALGSLDKVRLSQGLSVGAVWTAFQTARRLGIEQALGSGFPAQLALWQGGGGGAVVGAGARRARGVPSGPAGFG